MGASAEDTEAELIRKICETELLAGKKDLTFSKLSHFSCCDLIALTTTFPPPPEENLLCSFLPLLVRVCSSPGRYCHPQLTTAACLALSQYMMIRSDYTSDYIVFL